MVCMPMLTLSLSLQIVSFLELLSRLQEVSGSSSDRASASSQARIGVTIYERIGFPARSE